MGPSRYLWCLHAKQRLLDLKYKSLWYQTSPIVLCMQNSVISDRNTCLYGFQPSSVGFGGKRETLGPELQVSVGPRSHL